MADPLAGLPSVLAIRDLRRRIRRHGTGTRALPSLQQLLRLDPPSLLRAMRAAATPLYGGSSDWWTLDEIVAALGPSLTRRTLEVASVDIAGTGPLRKLWLHSVATARAAELLAMSTGLMHPEQAHLAGLLHDLPSWLEYMSRRAWGILPGGTTSDWMRHWNLPPKLAGLLDAVAALRANDSAPVEPTNPAALVVAAELLAELANFGHPAAPGLPSREHLFDAMGRTDLTVAQRLRREVEHDLLEVGLDLTTPVPEIDADRAEHTDEQDWGDGGFADGAPDAVLSLLGCSKSASYRGITTAATATAVRHLGFDRALYVKWIAAADAMVVRAKSDVSPRRIKRPECTPTAGERALLLAALRTERPVRIAAPLGTSQGLLHLIGASEALVVPVNRDFATPSFLVLDRCLSARPLQLLREGDRISTLAITTSMLNENLLLRRRRQRAQKFAMTDPLTRLANRRVGINTLEQEIARSQRSGKTITVLMTDMDDFKRLNDLHGHLQGDQALRATADVMRRTLRRSDTICRYGGEEFLVLLPETDAEEATLLAARLFMAVEARGRELQLPLTVSIGQATMRPDDTAEVLLQRADQALYASKAQGRNRFSVDADPD